MKRLGLDIGSTTIKCAVLDEENRLIYSCYERHASHILEKCTEFLQKISTEFNDEEMYFAVSGSAGMGLADGCGIPFVQEVYATRLAVKKNNPDTDCVIELGGEDAKILFLSNGTEVRMNGSCAGGTGAFIDQMSTLLHMQPDQMNTAAHQSQRIYTIASRCGVFAKSDIQPLINQGADPSDISASIYQAVVNQTIAGLAQGRPIQGNILYLGGPLTFSDMLRTLFDKTLKITGICPNNSLYYVAIGAALYADQKAKASDSVKSLQKYAEVATYNSLPALFKDEQDLEQFRNRHKKAHVPTVPFKNDSENVHIGIDAGSTTIKVAVINTDGELLFSDYQPNLGNPVPLVRKTLLSLYEAHPNIRIGSVSATGYGEQLIRNAFHCDFGIVETVAHCTAARHFLPDVDFLIDIGGQDMKCLKIKDGAISDIFLNEACSSGCGSFLQTFASALGYTPAEFAALSLLAKHPVDLGSRCTVFMNSSVKQAQKDGACVEDISAGLAISVVKNALYKVIRCSNAEDLGRKIVVQGGTFYNEAVLRAFEKELGIDVICPDISGLMGAYGSALYGLSRAKKDMHSSILNKEQLENFQHKVSSVNCQGCTNHCLLTINTFASGKPFISGNCCDRPITGSASDDSLNLFQYKLNLLRSYKPKDGTRGTIGIPLVLNMYELLPFWHTFFTHLGYRVLVSPPSSRELYTEGQATIPSDTVCFPAKLAHGHIHALAQMHPDSIVYPCMTMNFDEGLSDNHYNCPVVAYYPEVLADNCQELAKIPFHHECIDLSNKEKFIKHIPSIVHAYAKNISDAEITEAAEAAYAEYHHHMQQVRDRGQEIIQEARAEKRHIIILAGRPYHIDPEINHGIDKLIIHLNAAVITEASVSDLSVNEHTDVLNQWTYHARLYAAARYCTKQSDMDLVQLVSFGCGLDAITADETRSILENGNKLYTQLKIDEITNLGAVGIRLRSLFAALDEREIANQEKSHGI